MSTLLEQLEVEMTIGVYTITCIPTGKMYVGSSISIDSRWKQHRYSLNKEVHHSLSLQRAWKEYGEGSFIFKIIELIDDIDLLRKREEFFIRYYDSVEFGYNMIYNTDFNGGDATVSSPIYFNIDKLCDIMKLSGFAIKILLKLSTEMNRRNIVRISGAEMKKWSMEIGITRKTFVDALKAVVSDGFALELGNANYMINDKICYK